MTDSIRINDVEMWDHTSEVIEPISSGFPPYEKITIDIHKSGGRGHVEIVINQDIQCDICGEAFEYDCKYEKSRLGNWVHSNCYDEYTDDLDNWVDRFAARSNKV